MADAAAPTDAPAEGRATPDEFRMSLAEHLGELRSRLLRVVIAVLVLGGGSLVFAKTIYGLLMRPVLDALPPEAPTLVYTSAIEEINVYMKVGLYCGVILTTPVILWQLWGFVSPGLYPDEKKLAGPFVVFGTLAFVAGAVFCYFVLLPQMFTFLLREETAVALERRLDTAKLRAQDAMRFLRLGELQRAADLAKEAANDLEASGEGQAKADGRLGINLVVSKNNVDALSRLEGLGTLIDATREGVGDPARPVLSRVMDVRLKAIEAFGKRDFSDTIRLTDEAAAQLAAASTDHTSTFSELWRLQRDLGAGKAEYEANNWTRPMLSMSEQLTLVLVLELALGVIFELPLVMALLAMVGLVKASWLFKYQRHAFVVCLIVAAVITPTGDAVNLALMAGPMLFCYELGVLLVWLIEKRRKKQLAATPP